MLAVVATIRVKEGKEAEFEGVMKELVAQTRANEPGCKLYALHRTKGTDRVYVVLERYEDEAAFREHSSSEHFKAATARMAPCFDGAPKIDVLEEIET